MKRLLKSFVPFLLVLVAALGFSANSYAAKVSSSAGANNKVYKVLIDTSFVPFVFGKTSGQGYTGFDVDLIKAIAKRLGLNIELVPMAFDGIVPALQSHNGDLTISGFSITPQRAQVLDFSRAYFNAGLAVLTLAKDKAKFGTKAQIETARVGTQLGSVSADYVREQLPKSKSRFYSTIQNALLDLEAGRLDALVFDQPTLAYMIKVLPNKKDFFIGERLTSGDYYAIAFPKGSALKDPMNKVLGEMFKDGSFARIYESWFGTQPPANDLPEEGN